MAIGKKDNNQVPVILGTSSADGSTPVVIYADPGCHELQISDGSDGSDLSTNPSAPRDDNGEPTIMAVSSDDGITPIAIYANSLTGALLVKSS